MLTDLAWSLHLVIEPPLAALADPVAEAAQAAILAAGGRAIPDAVPRATRSRPFRPLKALIGPDGERWLPCHGVFPAARAADALARVESWKAERAEAMAGKGVRVSLLLASVGSEIIVEPQLHWPDALSAHQRAFGTPRQAEAHADKPRRPEARALAAELRGELIELLRGLGGGRLQIGRSYAYGEDLAPETLAVARALKRAVDPDDLLNPGVLGL